MYIYLYWYVSDFIYFLKRGCYYLVSVWSVLYLFDLSVCTIRMHKIINYIVLTLVRSLLILSYSLLLIRNSCLESRATKQFRLLSKIINIICFCICFSVYFLKITCTCFKCKKIYILREIERDREKEINQIESYLWWFAHN